MIQWLLIIWLFSGYLVTSEDFYQDTSTCYQACYQPDPSKMYCKCNQYSLSCLVSVAVVKVSSAYPPCPCSSSGLPPDGDVEGMKRVWQNAKDHSPKPMTILAALFHCPEEVERMDIRLKVSKEEKNLALFLVKYRRKLLKREDESDSLKPFTDFIIDVSISKI